MDDNGQGWWDEFEKEKKEPTSVEIMRASLAPNRKERRAEAARLRRQLRKQQTGSHAGG